MSQEGALPLGYLMKVGLNEISESELEKVIGADGVNPAMAMRNMDTDIKMSVIPNRISLVKPLCVGIE